MPELRTRRFEATSTYMVVETCQQVLPFMESVFNQKSQSPREQQHFRWAQEEERLGKDTDKNDQRWKEEKSKRHLRSWVGERVSKIRMWPES